MTHPCPTRRSSDLQASGGLPRNAFTGQARQRPYRRLLPATGLSDRHRHADRRDHGTGGPCEPGGTTRPARAIPAIAGGNGAERSEEHTSELQSLMRISYAVFCLKKKKNTNNKEQHTSEITCTTHKIKHTNMSKR